MIRLAVLSVLRQRGGSIATGLVTLVGVALLSAMAGMMATGLAADTPDADRAFLVQFPAILGSWILGIVAFATVSTVGVALGGRTDEVRGLRLVGATPRQVQRMLATETLLVSAIAAVPGILLGYALGAGMMAMTAATGVVSGRGPVQPGLLLPVLAAVTVVIAATAGAVIGSRAGANRSPVGEQGAARAIRSARPRRVVATALVAVGLASSSSALAMHPDSVYATAATGPGCVLVAVGIALFATELLGLADRLVGRIARRRGGPAARLAAINLRAAPARIRPAVTFLVLFVGVAAGTLGMQAIENSVTPPEGIGRLMATINYLVVGLVAAFMSIALINNLIASIRQRRDELAVMGSVGATRSQSVGMLVREVGVALVVAVVAGGAGAVATVIPFAVLKTGSALAAWQPAALLPSVAAAVAVALVTTVVVGRRTVMAAARTR